jgi:DNA-binding IclR family transcriptional regulator
MPDRAYRSGSAGHQVPKLTITPTQTDRQGGVPRKSLESVDRAVRVLRVLESEDPITLADVARRSELSEPTALRYLSSLCAHGLAERTTSGRYRLGWELFRLGREALALRVPRDVALPIMEQLRKQFNETVNLGLREGDELVLVETLHSRRSLKQVNEVGQRDPWHASALGKAMLAFMPDPDRAALLARIRLRRLTPQTIVNRQVLEEELVETRRRGYAIDNHEVEDDITCVGAAVLGPNGVPSYAISVSFPSHRVEEHLLERAGNATLAAAEDLRRLLGHDV